MKFLYPPGFNLKASLLRLSGFVLLCIYLLSATASQELTTSSTEKLKDVFWSPLTEFELSTLSKVHLAQSADPDALLALAIMASGNIRTTREFNQIKSRIYQVIDRVKPLISQQKNTWRKAFELHNAMHDEFFLANAPHTELQGYKSDQSQLSRVFSDKTYNCTSSALLYLILARYFGLAVEAVILPSHVFVQLTLPTGQKLDIETTSKTGFGLRHDKAYYENNNNLLENSEHWFRVRNLIPATYHDYVNRQVDSVYRLIADNMNHQHLAAERMAKVDRYRLQEVRSWLLPDDPQALLYRFYVFNNGLINLLQQKNNQQAIQLIAKAEILIQQYSKQMTAGSLLPTKKQQQQIDSIITFIFTSKAGIAFSEDDYSAAIDHFTNALRWVREPEKSRKIMRNMVIAHVNQGNLFSRQKDYKLAINWYAKATAILSEIAAVNNAVAVQDKQLKQDLENNIGSAYWNMAVPYLNRGDSYTAHEILGQCSRQFPSIEKCQQGLEKICRTYALPVCQ